MGGAVESSGIPKPGKDLAEGAGEKVPLKRKENFERRPHRDAYRAAVDRVNRATDAEIDRAVAEAARSGGQP